MTPVTILTNIRTTIIARYLNRVTGRSIAVQAEGIIGVRVRVKLAGAGGVGALDVPRGDLGVVFGH